MRKLASCLNDGILVVAVFASHWSLPFRTGHEYIWLRWLSYQSINQKTSKQLFPAIPPVTAFHKFIHSLVGIYPIDDSISSDHPKGWEWAPFSWRSWSAAHGMTLLLQRTKAQEPQLSLCFDVGSWVKVFWSPSGTLCPKARGLSPQHIWERTPCASAAWPCFPCPPNCQTTRWEIFPYKILTLPITLQ